MSQIDPKIDQSWKELLKNEFDALYFATLTSFLKEEKKKHTIYPPDSQIFNAFDFTPVDKVKVVILGQDPYHGPNQAHGLCFSVPNGIKPPPSLVNIYKEIKSDLNIPIPKHGNLTKWARQGVLLLNATLTVRSGQAGSHQKRGWEKFTDSAIKNLSKAKSGVVFLLWGRFAQAKEVLIDGTQNYVLKAAHPSPLSAHNGFFGSKHFSKTNEILSNQNLNPIDWSL